MFTFSAGASQKKLHVFQKSIHIKTKVWCFLVITDGYYCLLIHPQGVKPIPKNGEMDLLYDHVGAIQFNNMKMKTKI